MKLIKVVVFDFDDCLVLSEHIKQEGFIAIFSSTPGARKVTQEYVFNHLEQPRIEMVSGIIIRLKEEGIIKAVDFQKMVDKYVERYGDFTERKQIKAEEIPGALQALRDLSKNYILFISSATPQNSIEKVIKKKGWECYFEGIYGAPPGTKTGHLREIIERERIQPNKVVVVGDGESDIVSSWKCGTFFIGLRTERNKWTIKENFPTIKDHFELPRKIADLD